MKTFLKIFFGLILLLVIVVVAFLYTFDANDYKHELAEITEKITGRPVSINGDVDISLYPLIGIKMDDVGIENPPGFSKQTFATIDQLDLKIEIMPLLQKRLNIDTLVLNHLVVDLEKRPSGENNWSDFTGDSDNDSAESKFGLAGLNIGSVEVADANISWFDADTGKRIKISKMKLGTEAVVSGQPLPITFNGLVQSNLPEWQGSVFIKTALEFDDDSPVFHADGLKLVIKALLPGSALEKITIAMIADSEVNVQTQHAKLSNAKLSLLGLIMTGELEVDNIFSVPVIQGPLTVKPFEARALAERFKVTIPQMADKESLKDISLKTVFKTDFNSVHLDSIAAIVDQSIVEGFIHITGMQQPVVSYDLDVDKINLHDYMVVDSGSRQEEVRLPLELIRSSILEGTFDVETAMMDEIQLDKLHIVSKIDNGSLKITPISMLVGDSEVRATMDIDARETPAGAVTIEADNVAAEDSINPLLKTIVGDDSIKLAGMVNAVANLQVTGESIAALKKSAMGTLKMNMDETIVHGIDFDHITKSNVADFANKNNFKTRKSYVPDYIPGRETEFDSLSAMFNISSGKWANSDLLLTSEFINITGSGDINFINKKLSFNLIIDMIVKNTIDIRDKLRDHPMEYRTQGAFENLSYKFDADRYEFLVGRLLYQQAKERRIKETIKRSR